MSRWIKMYGRGYERGERSNALGVGFMTAPILFEDIKRLAGKH